MLVDRLDRPCTQRMLREPLEPTAWQSGIDPFVEQLQHDRWPGHATSLPCGGCIPAVGGSDLDQHDETRHAAQTVDGHGPLPGQCPAPVGLHPGQ